MTEARNIGIKKIMGSKKAKPNDIILFIDDDVTLYTDYIEKLLAFYKNDPTAGGACGYLCDGNKFLIDRWSKFPNVPPLKEPFTIMSMYGSNMSFRLKVFKEFMFNEKLKGYYADDDEFSARVGRKYKLYLVPYVRCIHKHTTTGGARQDPFIDFSTLMFNRYFIYRIKKKTLSNVLHYIFSNNLLFARILLCHKSKARALKGYFRGYSRILRNMFKEDITKELANI